MKRIFWGLSLVLLMNACAEVKKEVDKAAGSIGPGGDGGGALGGGAINELYVGINIPTSRGGSDAIIVTSEFVDPNANGTMFTKLGCSVAPTDANKDIYCIVQLPEFDLYHQGVEMTFNFPKSMCDYGVRRSSWFYNDEPGVGPLVISFTTTDGGPPTSVLIDGAPTGNAVVDNSGNAVCKFDYKDSDGGNCCVGKYNVVKKMITSATADDAEKIEYSSTVNDWGGAYGNCVGGHALDDDSPRVKSPKYNIPAGISYPIVGTGMSTEYKILPLQTRMTSFSAQAANHFYTPTPIVPASWPLAFRSPMAGPLALQANPYLEILCMDRAEDVRARIRLMVQDWATQAEFDKYKASPGTGNPNLGGSQTGFPGLPSMPFSDFSDWRSYLGVYPKQLL